MARPKKQSVEYFPHFTKGGRTIFILESKYGNDGYAFWFKLLEVLADSDGHYYDCSNNPNWEFLLAKTRCDADTANSIIKTLIDLGKVDAALWERRIIWVQNLVNNFAGVYNKRLATAPLKPDFGEEELPVQEVSDTENPPKEVVSEAETVERKEKKRKGKKREEDNTLFDFVDEEFRPAFDEWLAYKKEIGDTYKSKQTLRAQYSKLLNLSNNNPDTARLVVLQSIEKGWKGLFELKQGFAPTQAHTSQGVVLGVGERIENGRRTYGTGAATIPMSAPPRPSDSYSWNEENQTWIML